MTSSNAFADGATQNAGNVLTDRRTTRGVKPPGGGSSLAFGREETGEDDRGRATTGVAASRGVSLYFWFYGFRWEKSDL